MIPAPVEQFFCALNGDGALPRHQPGPPNGFFNHRFLPSRFGNPAHQADCLGLGRTEHPRAQTHVLDPAAAPDDFPQAAQRAHIGREANVDLLDRELRVRGADAHVTADADIDAEPERVAVQRCDHRLFAPLDGGDAVLKGENLPP